MSHNPFKNKTVLLIDDNDIDNFINEKIISKSFFAKNIFIHTSAKSALEYLKNVAFFNNSSNLIPDYIFLDINMPLLDGFQFLNEFEKLPKKIKTAIKIVILSASVNPADIEKSKASKQVVNFFNKPLSEKLLILLL